MEIPTDLLTWDSKSKTFSVEASCLRAYALTDAPVLKNPKTGGTRRFRLTRRERDRENDLVAWHFVSETSTPTMRLVIFND